MCDGAAADGDGYVVYRAGCGSCCAAYARGTYAAYAYGPSSAWSTATVSTGATVTGMGMALGAENDAVCVAPAGCPFAGALLVRGGEGDGAGV